MLGSGYLFNTKITLKPNEWSQISITIDNVARMMKLSVFDGLDMFDAELGIEPGLDNSVGSIGLGRLQPFENLDISSIVDHFIGCIDQLRFWKRFQFI